MSHQPLRHDANCQSGKVFRCTDKQRKIAAKRTPLDRGNYRYRQLFNLIYDLLTSAQRFARALSATIWPVYNRHEWI